LNRHFKLLAEAQLLWLAFRGERLLNKKLSFDETEFSNLDQNRAECAHGRVFHDEQRRIRQCAMPDESMNTE
jgi:hypothetical protein